MKRRQNIIAVTVFLVATLLVVLLTPATRQKLQAGFLGLISPFLKKGSEWDSSRKDYQFRTKKLDELEAEAIALKTENEKLRAENQALRGVEGENIRLKESIGFHGQSAFSLVSARVIGRPVANWWNRVTVDKGTDDGILPNMPVLTAEGLVGKVVEVAKNAAVVLLVTDEACKVAATVEGTKDQGIVRVEMRGGRTATNLQPLLMLRFVSKDAPLQPGQRVVTTGAGQLYPAGVTIGKIVSAKSGVLDTQAEVDPAVDLATLSDVFIVSGMKGNVQRK